MAFLFLSLESTLAGVSSNVVLTCPVLVIVLNGRGLAEYVAVAESVYLVARASVFDSIFMKSEGESTLLLLHPFRSYTTGGIVHVAANMRQKRSPYSLIVTATRHSTTASSIPYLRRSARISWETSWAVSAEVEPGTTRPK